jgi:uncharacterized protein YkwD
VLAVLFAALTAGPACVHAERRRSAGSATPAEISLLPEEIELANLINAFRAEHGLPALGIDERLSRAARTHSQNMARQRSLTHDLDGRGPGDRAAREGFRGGIFENVASGDLAAPRSYFELWIGSADHRANILALRTGAMGVGFARAGNQACYTAMFGAAP